MSLTPRERDLLINIFIPNGYEFMGMNFDHNYEFNNRYSDEVSIIISYILFQDLQAFYNMNAMKEIMDLIKWNIVQQINYFNNTKNTFYSI